MTGYITGIYYGYGAVDGIYGLYYAEISNAPLHIRANLRILNKKYTKIYELVEMIYISVYVVSRGYYTPIYCVYPCAMSRTPLIIKIICAGIYLQSVFYIIEMFGIVKKKYL